MDRDALVAKYLELTREQLPQRAAAPEVRWPVRYDHCFQRIVLDHVCQGVWYEHIAKPAYRNLTARQAADAVSLCDRIISGEADLHWLNQQSLAWRGKLRNTAVSERRF
ncbi:MAG: hypothetical protein AAGJ52_02905 [Pseudomonadota bacterium]